MIISKITKEGNKQEKFPGHYARGWFVTWEIVFVPKSCHRLDGLK
jgi:hypothetical protein